MFLFLVGLLFFCGVCVFSDVWLFISLLFKNSVKIHNLLLKEIFHGKKRFLNTKSVNSELKSMEGI